MSTLPSKLRKEPLVEVIFEIRFEASLPASSILPGLLISALGQRGFGMPKMDRLPASELPQQMREMDPNLRYAALLKLVFPEFSILISDKALAISTSPTYPGWIRFKEIASIVVSSLQDGNYISRVERYSLKYIDLIEGPDPQSQIQAANLNLQIGNLKVTDQVFQVRVEVPRGNLIVVIQIISQAIVTLPAQIKSGLIIDVDVLCNCSITLEEYVDTLSTRLDEIHLVSKQQFFDCLTPEAIESLEPIYDDLSSK